MDIREYLGFMGGLLTNIGFIPQRWRLFRLKSAYEISLLFTSLFVMGISFWLAYGISFGYPSVIVWNVISLVVGISMMFAKLKYGRVKKQTSPEIVKES
jgi:MtN3 and saliva related transmembrane protein